MATHTDEIPSDAHPARRRRERVEDGRRLLTAGHAVVISALALLLAALLNAQGIYKTAYNQPEGTKRDVTLALAGGLRSVSHALLLDRPRQALKTAVGRGGDDDVDTDVALPTAAAPPVTTTPRRTPAAAPPAAKPKPAPAARVAYTPKRKLRLWVAGDSLAITPGWSIVRAAGASPVIAAVGGVEGRVATGLARPDVFNWFKFVPSQVRKLKPGVVVLGFGGNDDKAYMTGLPQGVDIDDFGDAAWRREYARRVGGLMDAVNRAGAYVVWLGLPLTKDAAQTRRFDVINTVVNEEAERRTGKVAFVDTYRLFAGDDGGYTDYLPDASGRLRKVRAPDGVHLDPAGGDMVARQVLRRLNEQFDLTSWRAKRS